MALFPECTPQCAQNELDTADIVREAMLRHLSEDGACVTRADQSFGLAAIDPRQEPDAIRRAVRVRYPLHAIIAGIR